jgi:hypothetical protein
MRSARTAICRHTGSPRHDLRRRGHLRFGAGRYRVLAIAAASAIVSAVAVAGQAASEKTWRPIQVVTALKRAGLPIGAVRYYTARSDPNKLLGRPFQYTGKATFHDRRISRAGDTFEVDNGGSVETFSNTSDASRRFKYVCRRS